jgi:hypothetical protein
MMMFLRLSSLSEIPRTEAGREEWDGLAVFILSSSALGIMASLVFLCFLWASDSNNKVLHDIVASGWLARSVIPCLTEYTSLVSFLFGTFAKQFYKVSRIQTRS